MSFRSCWPAALAGLLLAVSARGEEIAVPGGTIDCQFSGKPSPALQDAVRKWVVASAGAIAGYYGGSFPVRHANLKLTLVNGREPNGGEANGWPAPVMEVSLGRNATPTELADDWLLPHECLHMGFPSLEERHHWLEEGLAVYCESVARARAGLLTPQRAWSDLQEGLGQGQPEAGDRGLDHTHTWGRTYWGGALFCLRADVEIHRRTENRRGLEHVLRAIVAAGGTIDNDWSIDRVISVGDHATSVPVLRELYEEMKAKPVTVDLPALWRQLGVVGTGRGMHFDDTAPLHEVRRSIMQEKAGGG
jgi:hypothetical protein